MTTRITLPTPAVHAATYPDIVASIGNTPLVALPTLSPDPSVRILAKLERQNPTGSVKDRISVALVDDLEARGQIGQPGQVLLESTSGNTGISLGLIATRRGYPITLVMAENVSIQRRQLVQAFGATIIDSPGKLGSNGAILKARELAASDDRYALVDQYGNEVNSTAHEASTGPEILAQCPEIDAFVAGLGTGGTLMGVARFMRRAKPGVRIVAAEPESGAGIPGLRSLEDGFVPEILDTSLLDERFIVSHRQAIAGVRALLTHEGIFAGPSSGATLVAARRLAREMPGATIVALLPDGGWKYLSGGVFTPGPDWPGDDPDEADLG
ncbi:MAG TPA: cysteine synthase family protein [Candidatus Limnocylindrales bacterium]|nr:cysteine synthase family protein [Candidatus Limnocylindrales bacterium]